MNAEKKRMGSEEGDEEELNINGGERGERGRSRHGRRPQPAHHVTRLPMLDQRPRRGGALVAVGYLNRGRTLRAAAERRFLSLFSAVARRRRHGQSPAGMPATTVSASSPLSAPSAPFFALDPQLLSVQLAQLYHGCSHRSHRARRRAGRGRSRRLPLRHPARDEAQDGGQGAQDHGREQDVLRRQRCVALPRCRQFADSRPQIRSTRFPPRTSRTSRT